MDNFRIIKEDSKDKTKFWELFEIDSFNFKAGSSVTLTVEQIQALLDEFIYMERIPEMALVSELANYIYINMGGTSKTPTKEVMAISYLMFASPNLRFKDMFKSVTTGIHFSTILAYLKDSDLAVATQYLVAVRNVINSDSIYDIVLDKFPNSPVIKGMTEEEYIEWIDSVTLNTADYIKGVIATRNAFNI